MLWAKAQFHGLHKWPDAPASQQYLRELHKHCFNIRAGVQTEDSPIPLNAHSFQADLYKVITTNVATAINKNRSMDCAAIAKLIGHSLCDLSYNVVFVSVAEDSETGVNVLFEKA